MSKGKITISKIHSPSENKMSVRLTDSSSGTRFVTAEVDMLDFMEALTGLGEVDCTITTNRIDTVGKIRQVKSLEFPVKAFRDKKQAAVEAAKHCPEGWEFINYFGSQTSFFDKDGVQYARTQMVRYV